MEGVKWYHHPDPTVDLSVIPFAIPKASAYDVAFFDAGKFMITDEKMKDHDIGAGSITYTVGLFRLLHGKKRNVPITYMGSIAMLPGDELIPVADWTDSKGERVIYVEGFLVATQSLDGLSGSPVFVRPEADLDFRHIMQSPDPNLSETLICGPHTEVHLLGLWQSSWKAR